MAITHCEHGHELTPENTFTVNNGGLRCRECNRLMARGYQLQRELGLPDRGKIEKQAKLLIKRQQLQDGERIKRQLEATYAQRHASGQVLSASEGKGRKQGEGGTDMPGVDGASAGDGEATEAQAPLIGALPKKLNATALAVTAPRAERPQHKTADATFMEALRERMKLYQMDGLEALRDLALMPISTNSMQNQVKFLAASKLAGNLGEQNGAPSGNVDTLLKQLNEEYKKVSPKIREVRERVISFDDEPKVIN